MPWARSAHPNRRLFETGVFSCWLGPFEFEHLPRDRCQRLPWRDMDRSRALGLGSVGSRQPRYRTAHVEVPTMEDRCYAITLSREDASSSKVVLVSNDECECEMFLGTNMWLER